jgi:hypothetical protein
VQYTLPPHAELKLSDAGARVTVGGRAFAVSWSGWEAAAGSAWFSPSYGVRAKSPVLELRATAAAARLGVAFGPMDAAGELAEWLRRETAA